MVILTLASVLTGMAVGLRFKVFAITPVIIVSVLSTVAIMAIHGDGLGTMLGAIFLNVAAVQIGYLCGTFAQSMLKESRMPSPVITSSAVSSPQSAKAYNPQGGVGIPAQ